MFINTLRPDYHRMAQDLNAPKQWEAYLQSIEQQTSAKQPVYVKFTRDQRRSGSIGKIVELSIRERKFSKTGGWSHYRNPTDYITIRTIEYIKVGFDGRKNIVKCSPYEIELDNDRSPTEGTIYKWEQTVRPKEPPKTVYDRIGEPVTTGDFVSFVHRLYGSVSLHFGTITRITDRGTVFVQTLKLRDGERSQELKCNQGNIVIVNDQLMKRLVMAKLAAD